VKKLTTAIGFVLVIPFAAAFVFELVLVGKAALVADYFDNDMGSVELTIGAILLVITAPVALGGFILIRRGRGLGLDSRYVGAAGGSLVFIFGAVMGAGLPAAVALGIVGSVAGWFIGRRIRARSSATFSTL
jgi:hypothetical protein